MDHIDTYLATTIRDRSISNALRGALALGKRTLNRYYDNTDLSDVYRISMGVCIHFVNYYFYNYFSSAASSP
jgi:hypothetical protein